MAYWSKAVGENDTGMCIYHSGEFQAVEFGHLDIEKKKVDTFVRRSSSLALHWSIWPALQKRGFVDVALQKVQGRGSSSTIAHFRFMLSVIDC